MEYHCIFNPLIETHMETITAILDKAHQRAEEMDLPYQGALLPSEALTLLQEAPGAKFHKMNEEHGFVDLTHADSTFDVGDRVHVIPNHICVAVNLHERVYGLRGETVEEVWNVDGRGKLQ